MQSKRTDYFRSSPARFTGTQSPRAVNPVQVAKPPNHLFQNHSQNSFFWKLLLVSCFWVFYPNKEPDNLVSSGTGSHCEPQWCSNSNNFQFKLLISQLELGVWATLPLNSLEFVEKEVKNPVIWTSAINTTGTDTKPLPCPKFVTVAVSLLTKVTQVSWVKMLISFVTLNKWLKPRLSSFCFQPFSTLWFHYGYLLPFVLRC